MVITANYALEIKNHHGKEKTKLQWQLFFSTHSHDDKVQPTPSVGEVAYVAHGYPLGEHLKNENDGEPTVHVMEREL